MRSGCERCGESFALRPTGRTPRFCSTRCRVAAHRAARLRLPRELTGLDRWTRRAGKRPITTTGKAAASTNPETWASFAEVTRSKVGSGLGVMLGDGLGCYDLDHCLSDGRLEPWAADVLASLDPIWTEVSMSGDGIHAFVNASEAPGYKRDGVEFYSRARFIAVTGNRWDG